MNLLRETIDSIHTYDHDYEYDYIVTTYSYWSNFSIQILELTSVFFVFVCLLWAAQSTLYAKAIFCLGCWIVLVFHAAPSRLEDRGSRESCWLHEVLY